MRAQVEEVEPQLRAAIAMISMSQKDAPNGQFLYSQANELVRQQKWLTTEVFLRGLNWLGEAGAVKAVERMVPKQVAQPVAESVPVQPVAAVSSRKRQRREQPSAAPAQVPLPLVAEGPLERRLLAWTENNGFIAGPNGQVQAYVHLRD